jgi:hypothetical protein
LRELFIVYSTGVKNIPIDNVLNFCKNKRARDIALIEPAFPFKVPQLNRADNSHQAYNDNKAVGILRCWQSADIHP